MNLKNLLCSALASICLLSLWACSSDDVILEDIIIDDDLILIPDPAFGEYLKYLNTPGVYVQQESGNTAYYLNPEEVKQVTVLNLSKTNGSIQTLTDAGLATAAEKINDLTGITYFTGLTRLVLTSNTLSSLDVTTLTALEALEMNFNLVGELDLSKNTNLVTLRYAASASGTDTQKLTMLNVSKNTLLAHLHLPDHNLSTIDLSQNAALTERLDLGNNPGPDQNRTTADIIIPEEIYNQLPPANRLGVTIGSTPSEDPVLVINEVLYDPSNTGLDGDANGDGVYNQAQDEFIELYNAGDQALNISGYKVYDASGLAADIPVHIFPIGTQIPSHKVLVLFGGGTPGDFGETLVQTSTTGDLSLNNEEDFITITDPAGNVVVTFDIEPLSNNPNKSYTRNPDVTGDFVQHNTVNSRLFSPGTKADGSPF